MPKPHIQTLLFFHLYPGQGASGGCGRRGMASTSVPVATRNRDNLLWAEDLFLPLDSYVHLISRNDRPLHLGVIASRLPAGASPFFVRIDRSPKYLCSRSSKIHARYDAGGQYTLVVVDLTITSYTADLFCPIALLCSASYEYTIHNPYPAVQDQ